TLSGVRIYPKGVRTYHSLASEANGPPHSNRRRRHARAAPCSDAAMTGDVRSWIDRKAPRRERLDVDILASNLVKPYCTAEGVGFEPTDPLRGLRFSRPVHSATMRTLQGAAICVDGNQSASSNR